MNNYLHMAIIALYWRVDLIFLMKKNEDMIPATIAERIISEVALPESSKPNLESF